MYVCMYVCIYVYMYICIYVYMYMCIFVYVYVCLYVGIYLCMHVCVNVSLSHPPQNKLRKGWGLGVGVKEKINIFMPPAKIYITNPGCVNVCVYQTGI